MKAANQIAAILREIDGAKDVKVEQVGGLPFREINVDKREIARLGLSLAEVQDVIGVAVGGQRAGVVFEGDRRFPILVRLDDRRRENMRAIENIPISLPSDRGDRRETIQLKQVASISFIEGQNQISRDDEARQEKARGAGQFRENAFRVSQRRRPQQNCKYYETDKRDIGRERDIHEKSFGPAHHLRRAINSEGEP
ncbi:efflux RND transporter permease subunit [Methylosinus sp. C49]|uniref:efflux RND transporter permease subunit n=1 Tax=Methylosinus sp. C49 TaxID=2699395 RepID=UPI001FCED488|nr:efflux RND transporter permease subunit [Methylosinus sp. C49]